jgi:hypothetical protein
MLFLGVFPPPKWHVFLISPASLSLHNLPQQRGICFFNASTQLFTIQDLVVSLLITSTNLRALDSHAIGCKGSVFCKPLCKRLLWKNKLRFRKKILLSLFFTAVSSENSSFFQ